MGNNSRVILHLLHQYLPDHVGGVELYASWLTAAQRRQGEEVHIFHRRSAVNEGLAQRMEDGVTVWSAWYGCFAPTQRLLSTFYNPTLHRYFEQVLDQIQPEIIHIQHLLGMPVTFITALRARRIPYVVTLWDFWWVCANAQLITNYSDELCNGPRAYLNCARCALARAGRPQFPPAFPLLAAPLARRAQQLRQILAGAARVIAPAHFVQNWYAEWGAPTANMIVAPPGLDYPADLAQRRGNRANGLLRVGYIGGIAPQKGVHVVVEAFSKLLQPLSQSAELWIAGDLTFDPVYTNNLKQMANNQTRFLGRLNRPEIWQMLLDIDLLVVPSVWYETFAFVISEAFAAGIPVIASNLGVMADRVRHEIDGLLIPPNDADALSDALRRFLTDAKLRDQLRQGVRPPLTTQEHLNELTAVYREITG
jgi:glycosyltransferase involved in cell wall biosynthesis